VPDPQVTPLLLAVGVVIIVVLVLVIVFLYRKKNKLHQKLEIHEIELKKVRENLQSLLDGTTAEIKEREFELLNRLISALEYRDIETANHITRMANYSRLIAKHLFPVDSPMASLIFLAAALHDIGKIGISDKILSKPEKLSEKEFNQMKRHTLIGYDILKDSSSDVIQIAAVIALTHHERYDGSGYPRGLKGEEIPIAGRIVIVADYFDALMSKRVYKDAWSIEKVLETLKERSGKIFDPVCLEAFFKNLDEILKIKDKYPDLRKSIDKDIEIEDELVNNGIILPEKLKRKIYPRRRD
jgi:response regulator RpfG family c-di-GMP phosphodiesterase